MNHVSALGSGSHRILGDISADLAQAQVVAGIQHAAVRVSSAVGQIVLALLGSRAEHLRAVKMLREQCLRDLRAKVSKIDHKGVASRFPDVLKSLDHMDLALDDADRTFIDIIRAVLRGVRVDQSLPAVDRQRSREAVTADSHDTYLNLWDVCEHVEFLLFLV